MTHYFNRFVALATIGITPFVSTLGDNNDKILPDDTLGKIAAAIKNYDTDVNHLVGRVTIDSVRQMKKAVYIYTGGGTENMTFSEDIVPKIYADVKALLPNEKRFRNICILANEHPIETLLPSQQIPAKDAKKIAKKRKDEEPLVTQLSLPQLEKGLQGRHIAMWQSHGYYYEQKLDRWEWQRARIFQTVEDLYTQSYVLPFLVPMLENAGAYVMMPRERDCNKYEVIVDGDGGLAQNSFKSPSGWQTNNGGFAYKRAIYINHENPFKEGTYLSTPTVRKNEDAQEASWTPSIPVAGEYAVYVSYQTLPNSADDALYTVHHLGGTTTFKVNQHMGGGTWIYLGTFLFAQGSHDNGCVTLSNLSQNKKAVITADAVKFGGGMGNIGRAVPSNLDKSNKNFQPITEDEAIISHYPRFCEGARYWMQWAGIPDSIYDLNDGLNDYNDDYLNRGIWVNYLAGGSSVNPEQKGLNIPIDLSFAFHSDAGTTLNDKIIGTLAIYDSHKYGGKFPNGIDRIANRNLADLIQSSIVNDIRKQCEPIWQRRQMWNKTYFEAWMPKVPAMLLELLSHQNFADMRLGLDPRFRFIVSRAIYKGMLRFLASLNNTTYVVQPLPVSHLMIAPGEGRTIQLSWKPTIDSLETTATPNRYIVYTRLDNKGWNNGIIVNEPQFKDTLNDNKIHSYKIVALNDGGRSFDSEIVSAGIPSEASDFKNAVLVVNGFDRISAPADFTAPGEGEKHLAGFLDDEDHGVPYIKDISYIGKMKEFRRDIPWMDDDASGFGDSYSDYEKEVIAGNTFDYPAIHGTAIMANGRAFLSCSNEAFEDAQLSSVYNQNTTIDLILGKQKQTKMGRGGIFPLSFKTFTTAMQNKLKNILDNGGNVFVSGAFVASDLWDNRDAETQKADKDFATNVLGYKWRTGKAAKGGQFYGIRSNTLTVKGDFTYYNELNNSCYVVESPDAIEPAQKEASTIMRYTENNLSAAVAYVTPKYKTFVMGVPFETIRTDKERTNLMQQILNFFK